MTTKAEKAYLDRVAALGCVLCDLLGQGRREAAIHHPRFSEGLSQRAQHWLAIPLCPDCHQGPLGVHGDRTLLRIAKVDEVDLLAHTIRRLNGSKPLVSPGFEGY